MSSLFISRGNLDVKMIKL